jgi:hypothetical protein
VTLVGILILATSISAAASLAVGYSVKLGRYEVPPSNLVAKLVRLIQREDTNVLYLLQAGFFALAVFFCFLALVAILVVA